MRVFTVIAWNSDRFIALFAPVVFRRTNHLVFQSFENSSNIYKKYTIPLTVAFFRDFTRLFFNHINHNIWDFQHSANHLP